MVFASFPTVLSLGLVLTSLINFAAPTVLGAFGMPSCTIAFVMAGWIMLVVENFMVEQAEKKALKKAENDTLQN